MMKDLIGMMNLKTHIDSNVIRTSLLKTCPTEKI